MRRESGRPRMAAWPIAKQSLLTCNVISLLTKRNELLTCNKLERRLKQMKRHKNTNPNHQGLTHIVIHLSYAQTGRTALPVFL